MSDAPAPLVYCGACGTRHAATARFCRSCGAALVRVAPAVAIAQPSAAPPAAKPPEPLPAEPAKAPEPPPESEAGPMFAPPRTSRRRNARLATWLIGGGVALLLLGGGYAWLKSRPFEPVGGATIVPPSTLNRPAPDAAAATAGYSDARTYCTVVGDIDQPDARYTGPATPAWVAEAIGFTAESPGHLVWRCKASRVMACVNGGITGPCEKSDLSTAPNEAMVQYCRENPTVDMIGAAITGHYTVHEWACQDGVAVATRQFSYPDTDGYEASDWRPVE